MEISRRRVLKISTRTVSTFALSPLFLLLAACSSPRLAPPAASTSATATPTFIIAATPTQLSGTIVTDDGQSLVLSHPNFYWKLKLPRDWVITYDTGFQLKANNPQKTAFAHLLSQMWDNEDVRPATGRDYVNYWKHSDFGDLFPIQAQGTQTSETEINKDKFGGPYSRYEFDDAKAGWQYLQVYASGGGPNSLVVTVMAKSADFASVRDVLDRILNSAELMQAR